MVSGLHFSGSSLRFSGWSGSSASLVRCCLFGWYLGFSSSLIWFVFMRRPSSSVTSLVAPTLVPYAFGSRPLWSSFLVQLFSSGITTRFPSILASLDSVPEISRVRCFE
ncbi:hypothetical protein U1Q18_049383 [Sarracenia purpurea var. burkii]